MAALLDQLIQQECGCSTPACCGTTSCSSSRCTVIQHGGHTGCLVNGKLFCRPGPHQQLQLCRLDDEQLAVCSLVPDLEGHVHGVGCGHEQVPHGDHFDYLVGDRLHHLLSPTAASCCPRQCLSHAPSTAVVDHGSVSVLRHRKQRGSAAAAAATAVVAAAGNSRSSSSCCSSAQQEAEQKACCSSTKSAEQQSNCCSTAKRAAERSCSSSTVLSTGRKTCCGTAKCTTERCSTTPSTAERSATPPKAHGSCCSTAKCTPERSSCSTTPPKAERSCCSATKCTSQASCSSSGHAAQQKSCCSTAKRAAECSSVTRAGTNAGAGDVIVEVDGTEVVTKIVAAGICCSSEAATIHRLLEPLSGVCRVDVNVVTKCVSVVHTPHLTSPATLVATLNAARLEASLGNKAPASAAKASWIPSWHILVCGLLLLVSLLSKVSSPGGWQYLEYVALGAVALGGWPIGLRAAGSVRHCCLDINVLMVLAVVGAIALADYEEAAVIVFLFAFAQWLEKRCVSRASTAVQDLMCLQPDTAVLAHSQQVVALDQVLVGAVVLVAPGERVPLDGKVVAGSTMLDESMLTGESRPVAKGPGDELFAGTVNCGSSSLQLAVTSTASDSTPARLAALMERAMAAKSRREVVLQRFARVYTPLVVAAALLLAVIPPAVSSPPRWHYWVYLALQVLVTACPCALVLSTPVANVCALTCAARHGVLLKGSQQLDLAAGLGVISFDKTGTLTQGHFAVQQTRALTDRWSEPQLLQFAAALEHHSQHPLAPAIIGHAASRGIVSSASAATEVQLLPGIGLRGSVQGRAVVLCSLQSLPSIADVPSSCADRCMQQDVVSKLAAAAAEFVATPCCIVVDGCWAGYLLLADQARPDACQVLQQLASLGVRCCILSGDNPAVVAGVGKQLGLEETDSYGGLSPEEKMKLVQSLKQNDVSRSRSSRSRTHTGLGGWLRQRRQGREQQLLAHVGDGINDAPALAAADVGVAMGVGGSALAVEAADVALFTNSLASLVLLVTLGRRVRVVIWANIAFAIATKLAVLVLIGLDKAALWIAVLADVGSALIVVCNSLTLLHFKPAGGLHSAQAASSPLL